MAIAATAVYFFFTRSAPDPVNASPVKTLAVLPFKMIAAGAKDEHLGLGMTDTLITRLSRVDQITVLPTRSVLKYESTDKDAVTAGHDLDVEAVLEGTVQRADDRIRVTVRLIKVSDRTPLWSGKFDEGYRDILAIQDSISERVTTALALELTSKNRTRLVETRDGEA